MSVSEDVSKSMFPTIFGYRFSKAFPHDTATALVMIAPRLLAAKRYFCTMESRSPSRSGRPVLYRYLDRDVFDAMLLFLAFLSSSSTLSRNPRTVLSFKFRNFPLNFLTAAVAPFSEAYFPMV